MKASSPWFRMVWKPALAACLLAALGLAAGCGVTETVSRYYQDVRSYFLSKDTNVKKRVTVVPFSSRLAGMQSRATDIFNHVLKDVSSSPGIQMVDVTKLRAAMEKVPATIKNREERILAAARAIGLNSIADGRIVDVALDREKTGIYGFRENTPFLSVELHITIWDVPNGSLLGAKSFVERKEIDETLAHSIEMGQKKPDPKLLDKSIAKMAQPASRWIRGQVSAQAWSGYLLAREGERVRVTVSGNTGLPVGSILAVYSKGEPIRAGSGRVYHMPGPKVGQIKIGELGEGASWAVPFGKTKLEALVPGLLIKTH